LVDVPAVSKELDDKEDDHQHAKHRLPKAVNDFVFASEETDGQADHGRRQQNDPVPRHTLFAYGFGEIVADLEADASAPDLPMNPFMECGGKASPRAETPLWRMPNTAHIRDACVPIGAGWLRRLAADK
jgi:hypothetical protein